MSQVSFTTSSPILSHEKLFRNLFSTVPSDRALNQAVGKLLQHYKWTRVGIITREGPRLSEVTIFTMLVYLCHQLRQVCPQR